MVNCKVISLHSMLVLNKALSVSHCWLSRHSLIVYQSGGLCDTHTVSPSAWHRRDPYSEHQMPLNVVRADICVGQAANIEPRVCLVTSLFVPVKVSEVHPWGIYGTRADFFDHGTLLKLRNGAGTRLPNSFNVFGGSNRRNALTHITYESCSSFLKTSKFSEAFSSNRCLFFVGLNSKTV